MQEYYASKDGQQIGPLSKDELVTSLQAGRFAAGDLVWQVGTSDWVPLSTFIPPALPLQTASFSPQHLPANSGFTNPPPKEKVGCFQIVGYAILGIIGLAIIGAMFGDSDSSSDTGSKKTVAVAKDEPPRAMRETFNLGKFSYVITSAKRTGHIGSSDLEGALVDALFKGLQKDVGGSPSPDGSNYLVVRYRIKNEGKESAVVSTSDFKVLDSKGREFTPSSDATAELVVNQGADFLLSELQPGLGQDGVQAFELPNESFDGQLMLVVPEKGLFTSGEIRVRLGL